jgi:hypothetical protein
MISQIEVIALSIIALGIIFGVWNITLHALIDRLEKEIKEIRKGLQK